MNNHKTIYYRNKGRLFALIIASAFFASPFLLLNSQASLPTHDSQGQAIPSLAPMLKRITDGVVNISSTSTVKSRHQMDFFNDPLFNRFFRQPERNAPEQKQTHSLGSGVIIDAKKGYVLTNNHVIDSADNIKVTLKDGRTLNAELIGTDPKTDIALLKISADKLTAIPLSNSDDIQVGDFAVAIGNPFGLDQTVTSGIISALGRNNLGIEGYEDFIQTDASINPGNSGGALVNLRGQLLGINTAILSKSGGNVGIGFAIPVNMVKKVMEQLLEHGTVKRGILGVHIQDLTPELAAAFNIKQTKGAVIAQVIKGTAADRAGLKNGDVIVEANRKRVKNASDLRNTVGLMRPGEKIKLELIRGNKSMSITAKIGGDDEFDFDILSGKFNAKQLHSQLSGASLAKSKDEQGVEVVEVSKDSPAWQTGLRAGDRIIAINRHPTNSIKDIRKFTKDKVRSIALNIIRGNSALFLVLSN